MASKHHSLQMGEVADLLDLFLGFETQNRVQLECRFSLARVGEKPDLAVTMGAWEIVDEDTVPKCLASVSVRCLDTNLRNLRDVVTHCLYALDFRLALDEFDSANPKR